MTTKASRWDDPRWHLVIVVPLLFFVIVEDGTISRCLTALALSIAAFRYGCDSARRTSVKTSSLSDVST
ncbi:hypothetical protein [Streptomyces sp. NPDC002922]|uniref:hypothetical protein n=1 Tax=Streptomyces sp. NPDC002922 TaxID=3154439 RepID=UPI0033BC07BC